jgi:anti-anti-sigma factor
MDGAGSSVRRGGHGRRADFEIERRSDADGTARLILRGELDLASRRDLRDALVAEHRAGTAVIIVLDQLDYLDSAGIGELVDGSRRARSSGRRFAVTPGTGNVQRVLSISGALDELCAGPIRNPAEREAPSGAVSATDPDAVD